MLDLLLPDPAKIAEIHDQSDAEKGLGVFVFYVITPLVLLYGVYRMILRLKAKKKQFCKQQKYSLHLMFFAELINCVVGIVS